MDNDGLIRHAGGDQSAVRTCAQSSSPDRLLATDHVGDIDIIHEVATSLNHLDAKSCMALRTVITAPP